MATSIGAVPFRIIPGLQPICICALNVYGSFAFFSFWEQLLFCNNHLFGEKRESACL